MKHEKLDTQAIHAGSHAHVLGAVNLPIFQSSTYLHDPEDLGEGVRYHRLNNSPHHRLLAKKLAALEGTEDALVTASGMAAITTTLLALVPKGGHVIAQAGLYAGTRAFFEYHWNDFGRLVTFVDQNDPLSWEKALRHDTKAFFFESLENPLMRAADFTGIRDFAKRHGLLTLVDNTFPSPVNFRPASLGFDVVLHSATKYLNGHSDIIAGAVCGSKEHVAKVKELLNVLGGCLDPHSCFLLERGLKTLGIRVRAHNENAAALAQALTEMKTVRRVMYPGLASHPDHARVKEHFDGFGAMITFDFAGDMNDLEARLKKLELAFNAPSLGGPETLITLPAQTSFAIFTPIERQHLGISDTLVRISVGLEDANDLIEDFRRAFDSSISG